MKILTEIGSKPDETLKKYGDNPEFKELLKDFSQLMGNHFTEIADKKEKEKKEEIKKDPVMQIIENDPEVKAIMADPKVMQVINYMQRTGSLDLYDVMRRDP